MVCTGPALCLHGSISPALEMRCPCIPIAWETSRNPGGITGMETIWPDRHVHADLALLADMINHRREVSSKFGNKLGDFIKTPFQSIQARPQRSGIGYHAITGCCLVRVAFKYRVEVFRLPAESHGQRFQRPPTTAALDRMALDLPHDGRRHMRTLRKLTLTPAELANAIADCTGDRSPIFRHGRSSAFHFHRRG